MHIAIISPYSLGPVRGNLITVNRIAEHLELLGINTDILPLDVITRDRLALRLDEVRPDLILAFHALLCGEVACQEAERLGVPCVITTTGGDINDPLFGSYPRTVYAINAARHVVCFDDAGAALVLQAFPGVASRLTTIPQGVVCMPLAGRVDSRIPDGAFVALLPAAIRPVKNIEEPLHALAGLARAYRNFRLIIAGGVLDNDYAIRVQELLSAAPFAVWLGEIPHECMGDLYARADLVLNCSHNEGMPNSLLEAMAHGRPVVAADIPGNRSLVRDNETGWLYSGGRALAGIIEVLMNDPARRAEAGKRAKEYVAQHFSPNQEAERYRELFCRLLADTPRKIIQERLP